jgi:hypothetical protein
VFADALVPIAEVSSGVPIPRHTGHPPYPDTNSVASWARAGRLRLSAVVIVFAKSEGESFLRGSGKPGKQPILRASERPVPAFTPRSSRYLNCPSNLIGHDRFNKPANGLGDHASVGQGPHSQKGRA